MPWWIAFSEIVRNFGLVLGVAIGIFLAWQHVRVANKQAETQIRQSALACRSPGNDVDRFWSPLGKTMNIAARTPRRTPARIDLSRTFIRRTDLSRANLVGANLSYADCTNVNFRGANLKDALLEGTILRGADLTGARNLTREQIALAVVDERTLLPDGLR